MEMLILLTYTAICVFIFKLFKIPLNKWSVPTAVLGGVVLVGAMVLAMNYNHPFTRKVRQVYVVTPIVPEVRARVLEVPVTPNTPVKKGDPLVILDDTRYQARVAQLEAQLADTSQLAQGNVASVAEARARVAQVTAKRDQAVRTLRRYEGALSAFSKQQVDTQRELVTAANADLQAARAALAKAETQLNGSVDGDDPAVAAIKAQLDEARFDLENTIIRAPVDGFVTQLAVRPGMMAVPLPLKPLANFVNSEKRRYVGAFRQQSLLRLQAGNEAEVTFTSLPGQVFTGKLVEVLPTIAEAQLSAGQQLVGGEAFRRMDNEALAIIELEPNDSVDALPMGVSAQAAVYSEHLHHVAIIRRILLRMMSWQHYLYVDH
ncbi:MAG: HlyD family secretion protein [Alcanivorax sp.]|jgi:multidrug resistance efflux pump|uniref:HlyD family secretion protein n=1 Tax=Alcanivorax sp. TaxID=1872427 RepID=UPI0019A53136|nr:HlyD family secretion protein [Alcanivorax sp.]MBD3643270.1 HlyD family secretion protein [Alcanivorax sp.]MDF1725179.1 HlyD family secretion protein [Alcanivorax sp.]